MMTSQILHFIIHVQCLYVPVKHFSLIGVSSDESIDLDGLVLTNPVTASLSLEVVLWVPVGIVDYDGISSCEVDTKTTSPRAKEEDKPIRC